MPRLALHAKGGIRAVSQGIGVTSFSPGLIVRSAIPLGSRHFWSAESAYLKMVNGK
jgi:hypothetical protein